MGMYCDKKMFLITTVLLYAHHTLLNQTYLSKFCFHLHQKRKIRALKFSREFQISEYTVFVNIHESNLPHNPRNPTCVRVSLTFLDHQSKRPRVYLHSLHQLGSLVDQAQSANS